MIFPLLTGIILRDGYHSTSSPQSDFPPPADCHPQGVELKYLSLNIYSFLDTLSLVYSRHFSISFVLITLFSLLFMDS